MVAILWHALNVYDDASNLRRFRMSLHGHIVELQKRHDLLKKEVEQEQLHPKTNERKILELKRKKLKIKDELIKLQRNDTH